MAGTTNWNIPLVTQTTQIGQIGTLLNAHATALDAALTSAQGLINKANAPKVATQAARDALFPVPTQGDRVFRSDLGVEQVYFGLYHPTTNPAGKNAANWYSLPYNPSAFGYKSGAQSFTNGAGTMVTFDILEVFDGASANASAVTVPVAGWYRLSGRIGGFSSAGGSDRWLYITKNSAAGDTAGTVVSSMSAGAAGTFGMVNATAVIPLAAGDVIRMNALQNSGGSANLSEASFSVEYVSPRS
jgi:hypothetical protein